MIPPPKPRKLIETAGFLCEIFFKKLFAKPKHIGETKHKTEPIEKFRFSRSPNEIMTQAAKMKTMPIHNHFEMFSLKRRNAIKDVEINSKDPSNEALLLDKYWSPNISEIAAPL